MSSNIKCPFCGEIIDGDPFDSEQCIEDFTAYSEEHYDCPHCNHWFTVYFTYDLTLKNVEYRKRD